MVYIIIGVIFIIVGVVIGIATDTNPIPTILIVLGVILAMADEDTSKGKPSAMDVYQGKTTLEVTYKDGVAVDSVAVFKEKR